MKLSDYLINEFKGSKFISVTGGGGKSSLLKLLGSCIRNRSVLLTTTTKFQNPEFFDWGCDYCFSDNGDMETFKVEQPCRVLFANKYPKDNKKWQSPDLEFLEKISANFDITIAEADGSRRLPLKIHTQRDPVIATSNDYSITVMGIWALGSKINENVFGYQKDGIVDQSFLNWYINTPQGLLKGNAKMVIVNGSENATEEQMTMIRKANWPKNVKVIAASILNDEIVEIVK